jgi:hypothetical protein
MKGYIPPRQRGAGGENSKLEQCSGGQINLPAMDVPDALPDDQHRYDPKLVPCRPLISFAYGLLVVRRIDDLIVEVNGLAVFAVGEFGKVALTDHVSSPLLLSRSINSESGPKRATLCRKPANSVLRWRIVRRSTEAAALAARFAVAVGAGLVALARLRTRVTARATRPFACLIDALALRQIGRIIARRAGAKATNGEAWIERKPGLRRGPRFIDPGEIRQGASVVQTGAPATAAAPSLLVKTKFVGATAPVTSYHVPESSRWGQNTCSPSIL